MARQALAIRQAVLGERHPDTAASLNNLAGLLEAQGDSAAAKPLFEQALPHPRPRHSGDWRSLA